jgi:site-specific recombinase XerD
MKPTPGLIARFKKLAAVQTRERNALCDNTKATYIHWLRLFWKYIAPKPAGQWTGQDVELFMWHLEAEKYAPKSRRQALCALVYVFKHVLNQDPGRLNLPAMPKEKPTLRIIPSRAELGRIFAGMKGQPRFMAALMYGSGMRVMECCTLRIKDIDFEAFTIRVHGGKGDKDRLVLLPENLVLALQKQVSWRLALHHRDCEDGAGFVDLPGRFGIKNPSAARSPEWQFLFPSTLIRGQRRWHTTPESVQQALKMAVKAADILKRVTPHTLRHAYCTHSLRSGNDAPTVQELMGHDSLDTTMIYSHADRARGVSPLDVADLLPARVLKDSNNTFVIDTFRA